MRAILCLLFLLVACTTPKPETSPPPPPESAPTPPEANNSPRGTYFVAPGAPDPLACKADTDCTADTIPADNGCCIVDPTPQPQSNQYRAWLAKHRGEGCAHVRCAAPPVPAQPAACTFEVTCVQNRCQNSCPQ